MNPETGVFAFIGITLFCVLSFIFGSIYRTKSTARPTYIWKIGREGELTIVYATLISGGMYYTAEGILFPVPQDWKWYPQDGYTRKDYL